MNEMTNCSGQLPLGIAGREDIIFGNIVEIHEFHKKSVDFHQHFLVIHTHLRISVTV